MASLIGKKILVTGSSRGIGAGICHLLAKEGAELAVTFSNSKEKAQQVVASLKGDKHICLQLNINDEDSIKKSLDHFLDHFGQIDGLVNNAGITKDQLLLRMKPEDFDQVIQTNLRGSFLCTKAVLKPMIKKRQGSIVNITSVIGQRGNPGQSNYAASKAGTEAFAKSVAQEVANRNIRINCIAPGFIATEMTEVLTDEQKQAIVENVPMGRIGSAEDVAHAVRFLLSEEANYITGQTIAVNGGLYM